MSTAGPASWDHRPGRFTLFRSQVAAILASASSLLTWRRSAPICPQNDRERELEQRVLLLQTALDHTSHGIQMVDRDGRVVVINRRAMELLDLPEALMATRPLLRDLVSLQQRSGEFDTVPVEIRAQFEAGVDISQTDATYRRRRPDGRLLEIHSMRLEGGGAVRTHTDITLREAADAKISFMARHDGLTGLANRHLFLEHLTTALQADEGTALLCIDLDGFKQVNDTLGHPVGDALLRAVAGRLLGVARPGDMVARLGGDEFAITRTPLVHAGEIRRLADDLVAEIARPFDIEGNYIAVGASIGAAAAPPEAVPAADRDELLRQADLALYEAKNEGRGTCRMFEPRMAETLRKRHNLEIDLRRALAEDAFEMYYQPVVDMRSGGIVSFEALLRWRHLTHGVVSAADFIPLAESVGLIGKLGQWVLHRACEDAADWPAAVRIAINLSPMQFRDPELVSVVRAALARHRVAPERLELEVTESVLLHDTATTQATLRSLRELGARIALDDFGTGYSSLSYLLNFPFDRLKIDRSFISGVGSHRDADAIVRSVIGLAGSLGIQTVAEGVERAGQFAWLRRAGCDLAQGYLFSRARAARDVPSMLQEHPAIAEPVR